ncbi:hypothetical protein [Anaeromicropila populeti]|uniref:Uncharacterized protein n=1 Tax=Anaeromicropila populeti TaxID=37658 RepID=A0A1I6KYD3_9FIRM|nr:hypothetical protein [Anaeromicropila populeti]SFR96229.1 hypothetical protein SAMN05661086_02899 [Anaeromicropila populeti]
MDRTKVTHLSMAMELLNITGKELAAEIGTDTTTISKWRKGQRKLNYHSEYPERIAKYMISERFETQYNKLLERLSDNLYKFDKDDLEEVTKTLGIWLTDEVKEEELEKDTVKLFYGLEGWRTALDEFLKCLEQLEKGEKIYIGDFGDINWNDISKEYEEYIVNKYLHMLEKGHSLVIIDKINHEYKPYITLLRWMSLYLSQKVEVRYIEAEQEEVFQQSIYAVENQVAMIGTTIQDQEKKHLVYLQKDNNSVDFYYQLIRKYEEKSKKLIYTSEVSNPMEMVEIMNKNMQYGKCTYMMNQLPSFRNMSQELLGEILEENHVEKDLKDLCQKVNRKRKEFRKKFFYRQIYDLDSIQEALRKEYIIEYDLSRIIGKEIRISQEQFRRQLEEISQTIYSEQYIMVLASFRKMNLNLKGASIIVQDDSVVIAWNSQFYDARIHSTELTFVGGYFNYLNMLWKEIPLISKSGDWTKKQFDWILDKTDELSG